MTASNGVPVQFSNIFLPALCMWLLVLRSQGKSSFTSTSPRFLDSV